MDPEELECQSRALVCEPEVGERRADSGPAMSEYPPATSSSVTTAALDDATRDLISSESGPGTRPPLRSPDEAEWHPPLLAPGQEPMDASPSTTAESPPTVSEAPGPGLSPAERDRVWSGEDERQRRYEQWTRENRERRAREQAERDARLRESWSREPSPEPVESEPSGPQTGEGFGVRLRGQTSDEPDAILSQGDFSTLGRAGVWVDPQDDQEYRGVRVRGGFGGSLTSRDPDNPAEVRGSALSVDAGIYSTDQTLTIGAGASLIEGGGTIGVDGNFSADRDDDLAVSMQGGIGPGAALRIHHGGDRDGDGVEELGFGVSLMDFGFDVRSETLHRDLTNARRNLRRWGETLSGWFEDEPAPAAEPTPGDPIT